MSQEKSFAQLVVEVLDGTEAYVPISDHRWVRIARDGITLQLTVEFYYGMGFSYTGCERYVMECGALTVATEHGRTVVGHPRGGLTTQPFDRTLSVCDETRRAMLCDVMSQIIAQRPATDL